VNRLKNCAAWMSVAVALWAQAPQEKRAELKQYMAARKDKFQAGDPAPDFRLKVRGGEQTVALSSFRGRRPVALVFGSYT
jgi:hypothetical protein